MGLTVFKVLQVISECRQLGNQWILLWSGPGPSKGPFAPFTFPITSPPQQHPRCSLAERASLSRSVRPPAVPGWGALPLGVCTAHFSFQGPAVQPEARHPPCPTAACSRAVITGALPGVSPSRQPLRGDRPWLCFRGGFWASRTEPGSGELLTVHQRNTFL